MDCVSRSVADCQPKDDEMVAARDKEDGLTAAGRTAPKSAFPSWE